MQLCARMAKDIYALKDMPKNINEDLLRAYASRLVAALTEGYSAKLGDLDEGSADYNMLKDLQKNVYQFSAAKDYTQMKALTQALVDDEGKLRTYSQFKQVAFEINDEHVNQWLKAEYDNAVASSQMASRWVDYTKNADSLPMLRYITAGDDRVRPAHAAMDGTTRPINDPWWNFYYPPNGWNCRCDVQQGNWNETPVSEVYYPDDKEVQPLFKFNAGKSRMAFPPGHAYFIGLPGDVLQAGNDAFENSLK